MIKLYAMLLFGIFLILLNAGFLSALMRSRSVRRAIRLLLVLVVIAASTVIFFTSYKMVLLASLASMALALYFWWRDRSQALVKRYR